MPGREKVIIRRVPEYNPELIQRVIRQGLEEFGLSEKARGRITIKPNVVMSHHRVTPSAFTRPEFLDGLIGALTENSKEGTAISIAEKCGAGLPTGVMFRRAGYPALRKKYGIRLVPIEESRKKTVVLKKGKIHPAIRTAREIVDRDFLIHAPKLKTNSLTQGLTASVKLNVGLLLDKERMWNHNFNLDEKIVDLLEVGYPDFIATDAIEISNGGNHLTQHGRGLGIVLMARNPAAHDSVCARIFHLNPLEITHLRLAHERGYGPIKPEEIEITGDISLEEIRKKTLGWETGFIRVEEVDCPVKVISGEPYCRGGCHGVFLDWLYMIKDRKPELWPKLPPWTVVIGKYKGDVTADRVMVIGTCSEILGKVTAKRVRKIRGCPPKHKDIVLGFFLAAGVLNPLFRLDLIIDAYPRLFLSWLRRLLSGRL